MCVCMYVFVPTFCAFKEFINAFSSANWIAIAEAMYRMRVPAIFAEYLKTTSSTESLSTKSTSDKEYQVTAGVLQGFVLVPTLWKEMYNDVLEMQLPRGVEVVGFAVDIILVATGELLQKLRC